MKKTFLLSIVCMCVLFACKTEPAETAQVETVTPTATQTKVAAQQKRAVEQKARTTKQQQQQQTAASTSKMKWYTFEEAVAANKKEPKKFMIDMYTDWCGWCKVMDRQTFSQPEVQDYVNAHFYPVKFDAERKDNLSFKGEDFAFMKRGRRGVHELAFKLMNERASYPTIVYLDENMDPIRSAPGFKKVAQIMPELKYAAEDAYKSQSFQQFQASMR